MPSSSEGFLQTLLYVVTCSVEDFIVGLEVIQGPRAGGGGFQLRLRAFEAFTRGGFLLSSNGLQCSPSPTSWAANTSASRDDKYPCVLHRR